MQAAAPASPSNPAAAPAPRAETPAAVPAQGASPATESVGRTIRYSMLLDEDTSEVFDDLVKKAKRRLSRHVDKSMLVRAVISMLADDASLRDQVFDEVGRRES